MSDPINLLCFAYQMMAVSLILIADALIAKGVERATRQPAKQQPKGKLTITHRQVPEIVS